MSDPLTPEELAHAEQVCAAATPEPWTVDAICEQEGTEDVIAMVHEILTMDTSDGDFPNKRDCDFIALARTLMPRLLARERERVEQRETGASEELAALRAHIVELESYIEDRLQGALDALRAKEGK